MEGLHAGIISEEINQQREKERDKENVVVGLVGSHKTVNFSEDFATYTNLEINGRTACWNYQ